MEITKIAAANLDMSTTCSSINPQRRCSSYRHRWILRGFQHPKLVNQANKDAEGIDGCIFLPNLEERIFYFFCDQVIKYN